MKKKKKRVNEGEGIGSKTVTKNNVLIQPPNFCDREVSDLYISVYNLFIYFFLKDKITRCHLRSRRENDLLYPFLCDCFVFCLLA